MKPTEPGTGIPPRIKREAERRFARSMDWAPEDARRAELDAWRRASTIHARAYRDAERAWAWSKAAVGDPEITEAAREVLRQTAGVREPVLIRRFAPAFATAAIAVLCLALGASWWFAAGRHHWHNDYTTAVGEQRAVDLRDGSTMLLDTDSEVTVHYGARARNIELVRGRAQFRVRHDAGRPFIVHAGSGSVRAVGTKFQVGLHSHHTVDVSLIEGVVSVDASRSMAMLAAGEGLQYDAAGIVQPPHRIDMAEALGWTQGEVVARDWSLPRLLAEMNRYSTTQLQIGDSALQDVRISGTFRAGDQQAFEKVLTAGWSIRTTPVSPHEVILFPR